MALMFSQQWMVCWSDDKLVMIEQQAPQGWRM